MPAILKRKMKKKSPNPTRDLANERVKHSKIDAARKFYDASEKKVDELSTITGRLMTEE